MKIVGVTQGSIMVPAGGLGSGSATSVAPSKNSVTFSIVDLFGMPLVNRLSRMISDGLESSQVCGAAQNKLFGRGKV